MEGQRTLEIVTSKALAEKVIKIEEEKKHMELEISNLKKLKEELVAKLSVASNSSIKNSEN